VKGQIGLYKDNKVVVFQDQKSQTVVTTPYDKIKSIVYQRTSKPRYAEAILLSPFFLFTKSKKHSLTIQYTDTMPVPRKFSVVAHGQKQCARYREHR
jgi:hypothetical protein